MIIVQFDGRYQRWALLLLRSLELHEPGRHVLCDTIGLDEGQLSELERAYPRTTCKNTPRLGEVSPADMANRKALVLRDAMDRYPEEPWFCLLDADMLARRRLDDLWKLVEDASSALIFTNGMWEGRFYIHLVTPSGIVLVRRDGRDLVDRWAEWHDRDLSVDGLRPRGWFWDQVTLFLAWCQTRSPVARIPIHRFADDRLDPDASIWSAHVPNKEGYFRLFQAEFERQSASRRRDGGVYVPPDAVPAVLADRAEDADPPLAEGAARVVSIPRPNASLVNADRDPTR
jgi:hypothetical protein